MVASVNFTEGFGVSSRSIENYFFLFFFFFTSVCFFIFDDFRHRDYSPGNKIVSKSSTDNALIQKTLTNGF